MKTCILLITLLLSFTATAQKELTHEQFLKDSLELVKVKLVRPQFKFDTREAFLEGQAFTITGYDAGVLLKDKLRFCVGYYSMKGSLRAFKKTVDSVEFGRLIQLDYVSLNTELIYKDWRYLSLGLPLEIAVGNNTFVNKNITDNIITSSEKGLVVFTNFGLSLTFKPMRFIGLKGMVSYRKMAFNQIENFNFDGLFTSIGLNIDVREIITDIKMFRLMKRHKRGNRLSNAVDIITD